MKRKLAFLLAAVMLLGAALPLNLSAKTISEVSPSDDILYGEGSLLIDGRIINEGNYYSSSEYIGNDGYFSNTLGYDINPIIANAGKGVDLTLELDQLNTSQLTDNKFTISLENAVWSFINESMPIISESYGEATDVVASYNVVDDGTGRRAEGLLQRINPTTGAAELGTHGINEGVYAPTGEPSTNLSVTNRDMAGAYGVMVAAADAGIAAVINSFKANDTTTFVNKTFNDVFDIFQAAYDTHIEANWHKRGVMADAGFTAEKTAMKNAARGIYDRVFDDFVEDTEYEDVVGTTRIDTEFGLGANPVIRVNEDAPNIMNFYDEFPAELAEMAAADAKDPTTYTADNANPQFTLSTAFLSALRAIDRTNDVYEEGLATDLGLQTEFNFNGADQNDGAWLTSSGLPVYVVANKVGDAQKFASAPVDVSVDDTQYTAENIDAPFNDYLETLVNAYNSVDNMLENVTPYANMLAFFNDFAGWLHGVGDEIVINYDGTEGDTVGLYPALVNVTNNELAFPDNGGDANFAGDGSGYYLEAENYADNQGTGVYYHLRVFSSDPSMVEITVDYNGTLEGNPNPNRPLQENDFIVIPFIITTLNPAEPVAFTLEGAGTGSSAFVNSIRRTILGEVGANIGTTTAEFASVVANAKGRVYLDTLDITEESPNVLQNGSFVVIPPDGFNMVATVSTSADFGHYDVDATSGLIGTATSRIGVTNNGILTLMDESGYEKDALVLTISGLDSGDTNQRLRKGTLSIDGLALTPQSNDPEMVDNIDTGAIFDIDVASVGGYFNEYLGDYGLFMTGYTGSLSFDEGDPDGSWSSAEAGELTGPVSGVTYQDAIDAFQRASWSIVYSAAEPVKKYSGLVNQATAKINVKEITRDSWVASKDTIFTVVNAAGEPLEDVKISRVEIKADYLTTVGSTNGVNQAFTRRTNTSGAGTYFYNSDVAGSRVQAYKEPYNEPNVNFNRAGNTFTVTDLYTTKGENANMDLTFYLSAKANFQDEVWVKIGGSAIDEADMGGTNLVKVADFYRAVDIETTTSTVAIGYQTYKVADVAIKENNIANVGASALSVGEKIQLAIGEFGDGRLTNAMISFNPLGKGSITLEGDASFNISTPNIVNIAGTVVNIYSQKALEFTVMRKGKSTGGIINLKDLSLTIDRTVPYGGYDLLVGGSSFVNNYAPIATGMMYQYDTFDTFGVVSANYVQVGTAGADSPQKNVVEIPCENNIYQVYVNGETVDLEAPLVVLDDNRLYVPLRFVSEILGVRPENVTFDDGTRKVFIMTNERMITFQVDSPVYTINGAEGRMIDESTLEEMVCWLDPAIGRTYVPYQYLAKALGIQWAYSFDTNSVTFNVDSAAPVAATEEVPAEVPGE